jgi:hypothetical protein
LTARPSPCVAGSRRLNLDAGSIAIASTSVATAASGRRSGQPSARRREPTPGSVTSSLGRAGSASSFRRR